jgi:predicted AAA+ superfamily ATPase
MYRLKIKELEQWINKPNRKPLIVNGARQVGKSWLIRNFAENQAEFRLIEVNFERNKAVHEIFKKNLDIKRILFELELQLNTEIDVNRTILFFDEIQFCQEAIMSLRYFYEEKPELPVIAAGSLLDFEFRNYPYPVGRVETLNMYPLNFEEFLMARGKNKLVQLLHSDLISNLDYNQYFEDEFHLYLAIGGMPECVKYFIEHNDLRGVAQIQDDLLFTYRQDFKKYTPSVDNDCLDDVLSNISKFIGGQIIYTKLSERFTGPTIKKGVDLLKTARLISKVPNVSVSNLPLTPSGKQFKLFYLDIGLYVRLAQIDHAHLVLNHDLSAVFKGSMAEQFVAQQLLSYGIEPKYWARTTPGANSEVDFVIQYNSKIIPIEVKVGKSGSLKSLNYLLENHPNLEKSVVYSSAKRGSRVKINFPPIYLAGLTRHFEAI